MTTGKQVSMLILTRLCAGFVFMEGQEVKSDTLIGFKAKMQMIKTTPEF